jgi:flagellar motility protein MotE (MotC chaperone)
MKWRPSVFRVRISRILLWVLLLGTVKILMLVSWETGLDRVKQNALTRESSDLTIGQVLQSKEALAQVVPPVAADGFQGSLSEEWARLRDKERSLIRREQDLKQLEQSIDRKLALIGEQQADLKRLLDTVEEVRDSKLKHLVDVYSNMKSKQAAEVLETLDETIAVKILAGMRGRTAGEILSFVNAQKAARLSSQLTHMQIPGEK